MLCGIAVSQRRPGLQHHLRVSDWLIWARKGRFAVEEAWYGGGSLEWRERRDTRTYRIEDVACCGFQIARDFFMDK